MPSATLNNSDPGSAIGQAGKSHSPASFKIKGQGGIKEKDNTSLKQRLHSAVPISQVPTTFCCRESAGARVLRWCQGTAPQSTSQCTLHTSLHTSLHTLAPGKLGHLPWWHHSSSPAARVPALQQALTNPDLPSTSPVLGSQDPIRAFTWVQITTELQQVLSPTCTLPKLQPHFSSASWQGWTRRIPGKAARHPKETSEHRGVSLPGPCRARSRGLSSHFHNF